MSITDDRIARLPKWAQYKIAQLEGRVADLETLRSAGPEGSNTFRWDGFDIQKMEPRLTPLGEDVTICFGDHLEAVLDTNGRLRVCGTRGGPLAIFPHVTNVIHIGTTP